MLFNYFHIFCVSFFISPSTTFLLSSNKIHSLTSRVVYYNEQIFSKNRDIKAWKRIYFHILEVQWSAWRCDWLSRSAVGLVVKTQELPWKSSAFTYLVNGCRAGARKRLMAAFTVLLIEHRGCTKHSLAIEQAPLVVCERTNEQFLSE